MPISQHNLTGNSEIDLSRTYIFIKKKVKKLAGRRKEQPEEDPMESF